MIFSMLGSGGAALNFKVVGNPKPESPAENTIWLNTDAPITSWIFSVTEPSPAEAGMVWISVGTSSPVEFNALKKNAIQVSPISAKQYIDGAWVTVEAKTFQGGAWVEWIRYLLNIEPVVQWQPRAWKYSSTSYVATTPTVSQTSNGVRLTISGNNTGAYEVVEDVDLTDIETITATIAAVHSGNEIYLGVGQRSNEYTNASAACVSCANGKNSLDVSSLTGFYDIYFYFASAGSTTVSAVQLD